MSVPLWPGCVPPRPEDVRTLSEEELRALDPGALMRLGREVGVELDDQPDRDEILFRLLRLTC